MKKTKMSIKNDNDENQNDNNENDNDSGFYDIIKEIIETNFALTPN